MGDLRQEYIYKRTWEANSALKIPFLHTLQPRKSFFVL